VPAIIEAAALLIHLVRGGVSFERLVWVGIAVLRDWFAGLPYFLIVRIRRMLYSSHGHHL